MIDVDGLELSPQLRELVGKVRSDDPFIAGVRVGQNQPRVVRLVIDLKQPTAPQLFTLAPVAAYRHRLVFDLYPTQERDPLLELIRDKEQAEQKAAQAVQDALGEFIGKVDAGVGRAACGRSPPIGARRAARQPAASHATPALPAPIVPPIWRKAKIDRLVVVALDPGHGGEDPGAIGPSGLHEKDVVLAIALHAARPHQCQPGMRAMLTRDADFFVPLQRARQQGAPRAGRPVRLDPRRCLHHAGGARRLGLRAQPERRLEQRGALDGQPRERRRPGRRRQHRTPRTQTVMRTLLDMSTTAQIKDSLKLGDEVLGQIGKVGRLHKGSVEQASFAVLKAPDIPSILVESAFISNPEEEAKAARPRVPRAAGRGAGRPASSATSRATRRWRAAAQL